MGEEFIQAQRNFARSPDQTGAIPGKSAAHSANFSFLVAACRWPHDSDQVAAIGRAAQAISDWQSLLEDARRHRVMPQVHRALTQLSPPEEVMAQVSRTAQKSQRATLNQLAELIRIGAAFEAQRIDWITIKGPALAVAAYGDAGAKTSHDIDLLIRPDARAAAFAILKSLGYQCVDAAAHDLPDRLDHVLKDTSWRHGATGTLVELHIRLFINRALVPTLGIASPREQVAINATHSLPTLARPELLVYLAIHGANTNWYRLKWIADFAAVLNGSNRDQRLSAARYAREIGVDDIYTSSLMLSAYLFDTPEAPVAKPSAQAQRLYAAGMRELTAPHRATLRETDWDRTAITYIDKMRFMPDWRYRWEEVRLMMVQAPSYYPGVPVWRRFTDPMTLVSRAIVRKIRR